MNTWKTTETYVIGLSQTNLLQIEYNFNWSAGNAEIARVRHGARYIEEATLFPNKDTAIEVLNEIIARAESISFVAPSIFESIIDGNDIDVSQLHIYPLKIGKEIQ